MRHGSVPVAQGFFTDQVNVRELRIVITFKVLKILMQYIELKRGSNYKLQIHRICSVRFSNILKDIK